MDAIEDAQAGSGIPTSVSAVVNGRPVRVVVRLSNTVDVDAVDVVNTNPATEEPEHTVKKKRKKNGISNRHDGKDRKRTTNLILLTERRSTIISPLKAQCITCPLKVKGKIESKPTAKSKATSTTKKKKAFNLEHTISRKATTIEQLEANVLLLEDIIKTLNATHKSAHQAIKSWTNSCKKKVPDAERKVDKFRDRNSKAQETFAGASD